MTAKRQAEAPDIPGERKNAAAIIRGNAEHYFWGDGCEGRRLVDTPELSVIEERMPPGAAEKRHRHARAHQCFYILAGEAVMVLWGPGENHALSTFSSSRTVKLAAGDSLHIHAGAVHQIRNESPEDVRFIVTSAPTTRGDREEI